MSIEAHTAKIHSDMILVFVFGGFFFLVVLGREPRALCIVGRCSIMKPHPRSQYILLYFIFHISISLVEEEL